MISKIWGLLKEKDNYVMLLACITTVITVIYATLRFFIYIYWSGYFNALNIDNKLMNLNFDGFVFQIIFISIMILIIILFIGIVDSTFDVIWKKEWSTPKKGIKKIGTISKILFLDFFISVFTFSLVNIPMAIVQCVFYQISVSILNVTVFGGVIYILEIFMIIVQKVNSKKSDNDKKTLENKIIAGVLTIIVFIGFTMAMTYYGGNCMIEKKNKIQLVEDGKYAITYCTGDKYVLHKIEIKDGQLLIQRNNQKIIGMENCEYEIKSIKKIFVVDGNET